MFASKREEGIALDISIELPLESYSIFEILDINTDEENNFWEVVLNLANSIFEDILGELLPDINISSLGIIY